MDDGDALEALAQYLDVVQPSKLSLDNATGFVETTAMRFTAMDGPGGEAGAVKRLAIFVVVVPAITLADAGVHKRRPRFPRIHRIASTSGSSWVTSLRLAPVSISASGMPRVSVRR